MSPDDYLAYGGSSIAHQLDLVGTLALLRKQGISGGQLAESRRALLERKHDTFVFESFGSGYCDFCFAQLMGGEYEELQDQRRRCTRCSRSVLSTEQAFRDEFERVKTNMEIAFGITLRVPAIVKMVNAREIAKQTGETFTPTEFVDPRVLGFFAVKDNVRALYIENGSPRLAAVTTLAHELTHAWQDANWKHSEIQARYGRQNVLPVSEGMAVWAQIQYLLFMREFDFAERQFAYSVMREDEYGLGFRAFLERYPLSEDGQPGVDSPFSGPFPL